jgi:hypothetical protein
MPSELARDWTLDPSIVRLSATAYNDRDQFERLATVLPGVLAAAA